MGAAWTKVDPRTLRRLLGAQDRALRRRRERKRAQHPFDLQGDVAQAHRQIPRGQVEEMVGFRIPRPPCQGNRECTIEVRAMGRFLRISEELGIP